MYVALTNKQNAGAEHLRKRKGIALNIDLSEMSDQTNLAHLAEASCMKQTAVFELLESTHDIGWLFGW